jgi:hypothetical protein
MGLDYREVIPEAHLNQHRTDPLDKEEIIRI